MGKSLTASCLIKLKLMSEEDKTLSRLLLEGIRKAQRLMLERKAKLGESVVYADAHGRPYQLTAEEALVRLRNDKKE